MNSYPSLSVPRGMKDTLTQVGPLQGGRQVPAWLEVERSELAQKARRERRRFFQEAERMRKAQLRAEP